MPSRKVTVLWALTLSVALGASGCEDDKQRAGLLEKENADLRQDVQHLREQLAASDEALERAERDRDKAAASVADLREQLEDAKKRGNLAEADYERVSSGLDAVQELLVAEKKEMQDNLEGVTAELTSVRAGIERLEETLAEHTRQATEVIEELNWARSEFVEVVLELEAMRVQLELASAALAESAARQQPAGQQQPAQDQPAHEVIPLEPAETEGQLHPMLEPR